MLDSYQYRVLDDGGKSIGSLEFLFTADRLSRLTVGFFRQKGLFSAGPPRLVSVHEMIGREAIVRGEAAERNIHVRQFLIQAHNNHFNN